MGNIRVTGEGSDNQTACWAGFDVIERKTVDVDDLAGAFDVELHQVDERGAPGYEANLRALLGRRGLAGGLDSLIDGGRLREGEAIHNSTPDGPKCEA